MPNVVQKGVVVCCGHKHTVVGVYGWWRVAQGTYPKRVVEGVERRITAGVAVPR